MVQLPLSALRRRASNNSSTGKAHHESCVQNVVFSAWESSPEVEQSGFPRQQLANLSEAYEVDRVLGRGAFGIVQTASPRKGGLVSAVKTLAKDNHIVEAMANREIDILRALAHSNICKLLHVCEDPDHIHLVLECIDGHELFDEIFPGKPMKEPRAACIMRQVFEAVQYCHELTPAIIHRDLKPENIMVANGSNDWDAIQVKIIDWGLAALCPGTIQTPIVGTACYMAPESVYAGIYSSASDMWSCGVILYMLLTGGHVPPQFASLLSSDASEATFLDELGTSKLAQDILHSLLKREPDKRLTAAPAATHQWTMAISSPGAPDENVPTRAQLEAGEHSARPMHTPSQGNDCILSMGDCADLAPAAATGKQQLAVSHVELAISLGNDFVVFDDFASAGHSPREKVEFQGHFQSNESQGDLHLPSSAGLSSSKQSCRSLRQPLHAITCGVSGGNSARRDKTRCHQRPMITVSASNVPWGDCARRENIWCSQHSMISRSRRKRRM